MIKLIPLSCTILAGISTLLGYLIIFINKKYQEKTIVFSLSFSAGILLSISILQLIPESYKLLKINDNILKIIIFLIILNIGLILSNKISKIKYINNTNSLYRLGILSVIIIILHNIPEGIITYITTSNNILLGLKLTLGIAIHNIPEGITIAVPIYYSTLSKKKALLITSISAFSETLGAILCALLFEKYITNSILSIILGITAALMIEISIKELLKEALNYNKYKLTIISFLFGIIIMLTGTLL